MDGDRVLSDKRNDLDRASLYKSEAAAEFARKKLDCPDDYRLEKFVYIAPAIREATAAKLKEVFDDVAGSALKNLADTGYVESFVFET